MSAQKPTRLYSVRQFWSKIQIIMKWCIANSMFFEKSLRFYHLQQVIRITEGNLTHGGQKISSNN